MNYCIVSRDFIHEDHFVVYNYINSLFNVSLFRNLLVNLGLFAAGVWVARNLSDFDLMSPQPIT
jgi:hypothetical protein